MRTFSVFMAILLVPALSPAIAEDQRVTRETLLDRIQIEDLMSRYYGDMTSASGSAMADYFAEDGVLDINGMVYEGRDAIADVYGGTEGGGDGESRFHMLMTNPIINVDGDSATIWLIWTGVMNDNIRLQPRLLEMGREHTRLVKRDGRWLIEHRSVTADSGLPDRWDDEYEPRTYR